MSIPGRLVRLSYEAHLKLNKTMKNRIRSIFFVIVFTAIFSLPAAAQVKNTENTVKLTEGQASPKASIADVEWLAGSWLGSGLGGVSEEIWSKPQGGVMMGAYRLIMDGKPVFYEMMWLTETEGTLMLKLKHFHPNLVGWEEKDKTVDFKFVGRNGNRINFSGLTFERTDDKNLKIYLALKQKDGSVREELFIMKRN
jgi:Domain of unknown function (DUF6265)